MRSRASVVAIALVMSSCGGGHDRDAWCDQMETVAERGTELLKQPAGDDQSFDRAFRAYNVASTNLFAMEPPQEIADDLQIITLGPNSVDDEMFNAAGNRILDFIDSACPGVPNDFLDDSRPG